MRRFYVGRQVRILREKKGLSQLELAQKVSRRPETIARWENDDERGIKESDCRALAKTLGVTFEELVGSAEPPLVRLVHYELLPLLGTCPASEKSWTEDEVERWIEFPKELVRGRRLYLLKVRGDSMNRANIEDGDVVIVDADKEPANGQIVVARVDEKFPYLVLNIQQRYPHKTILLLDGGGYKKQAEAWIRSRVGNNLLHVFNMVQFQTWANKGGF